MIGGTAVRSYVANLTEEEKKKIVEGVLRFCLEAIKGEGERSASTCQ